MNVPVWGAADPGAQVERVRNGRIGKQHTVRIGLLTDPSGGSTGCIPGHPISTWNIWESAGKTVELLGSAHLRISGACGA